MEAVVSARDDAVADGELALAGGHGVAEAPGRPGPVASAGVEALARRVVAGDKGRLAPRALSLSAAPVRQRAGLGAGDVGAELELAGAELVAQVAVRLAVVELGEAPALGGVALAHDLGQALRGRAAAERAEPPARLHARELAGVADRHHLDA